MAKQEIGRLGEAPARDLDLGVEPESAKDLEGRELSDAQLERVAGGKPCATGHHIKKVLLDL
jgi:hypothetical protein